MNVFDLVEHHAKARPHALALLSSEESTSYAELVHRVRHVAAALRRRGIGEGDVVGLLIGNTALHVELLLALARVGAAAVSIGPASNPETLRQVAARYRIAALLGADEKQAIEGVAFHLANASLHGSATAAELGAPNATGGDRVCTIALTSGTTGLPKATLWSHARTIEHFHLQQGVRPFGPGVRFAMLMGIHAPIAASMAVRQMLSGATVVLASSASYGALCEAVDRLGATHVLSSPFLIQAALEQFPADAARFPHLQGLRLAGGLISQSLYRSLVRRVTPNIAVDYGSSEVGAIATGDRDTIALSPQAVGRIVPWVEAQAVDDQDRPLPAGEHGVLRFRSAAFPTAYHEDPGATARGFRGGWFYPGDVGRVTDDRMLVVDARADDVLNVGGAKLSAGEIERVLSQRPEVVESAAYAIQLQGGVQLVVAAVVVRGNWHEPDLLAHCREFLPPGFPGRLLRVDKLPRNAMGKVMRERLVALTRVA